MRRKPRQPWTKERTERAISLYNSGLTLEEVAEKVGSCCNRISRVLQKAGVPRRPRFAFPNGSENIAWNGGRTVSKGYEYIYRPEHPHATIHGYVLKERLLMEKKIGRYLEPKERVCFLDGDTSNFKMKNLKLFPSHGAMLRFLLAGKTPNWTEDGKRRILAGAPQGGFVGREYARKMRKAK